jgi:hypothetical protein
MAMTRATSPAETHAPAVARAGQFSLRRPAAVWAQVPAPVTLSLAGVCRFASALLTVLTVP